MTTYTVFDTNDFSNICGRGLNEQEAMAEILSYDQNNYEIRKSNYKGYVCWDLYTGSNHNDKMSKTIIFSLCENEEEALQDIAKQVISADWDRVNDVMTDENYDEMIAELEDNEE